MAWKAIAPSFLFGAIVLGSFSFAGSPMSETVLDTNFYRDLDQISKFDEEKAFAYGTKIESDSLAVQSYLFNNSLNLLWEKNNGNSENGSERISGNAFLLNIFLPDWIGEFHPDRANYSPKSYLGGDELVLLLGTSFSFVKELFSGVSNWKSEVNEATTSVKLSEKSNSQSDHSLYLSHPWPVLKETENQFRFTQDYLYKLGDPHYSSFETDIGRPYYFKIDNKNVEAIYAAVDLEVNSALIDIDLRSRGRATNYLRYIQGLDTNNIFWRSDISDIRGEKYKFAVDFAVIKVKFNIAHLKKHYIDYLTDLYSKFERIPQLLRTELVVRDEKTAPLFIGGWETLSEKETDMNTMSKLFVDAKIQTSKTSDTGSKSPSEYASEDKFKECCEAKLYETYTQRLSPNGSSPTESRNYEMIDKEYYPNDEMGILFVKYKIKNKSKNWIFPETKEFWIKGFKSNSSSTDSAFETLKNINDLSDRNLIRFLEAKPKAYAAWREFGVNYSYFPYKNIQQLFFEKTLLSDKPAQMNMSEPVGLFTVGSNKYLNIAHHLDIPNMNLRNAKGSIALMKHPERNEKVMLGMYDGTSNWENPLSRKIRNIGKVALFISPWRYDLFNEDNKLSKPTLADSLKKKQLDKRIIQVNRFRIKSNGH
ncbi:hypothetical protein [Candidatus Mycoplasma haematohominis]|uniref:hypothetical protein n=1 Tax=Candidatus Mycoplasma haematohominis TaxID=1494318 RepID=UPI001C0A75A9|nr:hypothetical protein [Candidatus Mycoplasma haemohominis]